MPKDKKKRVCIIGGGLSGLAAAYELSHGQSKDAVAGVDLYEASGRLGGVALTEGKQGSWLYDLGPNSFNSKHVDVELMLQELSKPSAHKGRNADAVAVRVPRQSRSDGVLVWRNGRPQNMPRSLVQLITTSLLSPGAKWRILGDLFTPKRRRPADADFDDESLKSFFTRRFGREIADYVVNPAVAGILSGRPEDISVRSLFPPVYRAEQQGPGSVIIGFLTGASRDKSAPPSSPSSPPPPHPPVPKKKLRQSTNFVGGMERLVHVLRARLSFSKSPVRVRTNTPVRRLCRSSSSSGGAAGAWRVNGRRYDAVISTAPAYALADVQVCGDDFNAVLRTRLRSLAAAVRYAPMAVVALGYKRADLLHHLNAFGVLTPEVEKRDLVAVTFASSLYPDRVPHPQKDHALLLAYLGGSRQPHRVGQPDKELVDTAQSELRGMVGVRGRPVFTRVHRWVRGIPQYELGYHRVVHSLRDLESAYEGLFFAGNWCGMGVGIPDTLLSGLRAARRAVAPPPSTEEVSVAAERQAACAGGRELEEHA